MTEAFSAFDPARDFFPAINRERISAAETVFDARLASRSSSRIRIGARHKIFEGPPRPR